MLVLLFELGDDRYAIDVSQVLEVLPLVDLRRLPQAPDGVAGLFDFRGTPVPVIDLTALTLGRPAQRRFSTRIIVVTGPDNGDSHLLGLIAERATETASRAATDFVWPGVTGDHAQYLGPVATDERGLLQLVDVRQLLPAAARNLLFTPALKASWPSPTSNAS